MQNVRKDEKFKEKKNLGTDSSGSYKTVCAAALQYKAESQTPFTGL